MDAKVMTQPAPQVMGQDGKLQPVKPILPNTPEMEAFLGVGYGGLTVDEAKAVIKATEAAIKAEIPQPYPIGEVRNARAFLAAYSATPKPVATRKMWQRPVRA